MKRIYWPAIGLAIALVFAACEQKQEARVFFIEPSDGATISGPLTDGKVTFKVKMGIEGMDVRAAGEVVEGTGHHHIIVDSASVAPGSVVPPNDQKTYFHYGKGQTETDFALEPGKHTLTLQFANGAHISYGPDLSATISVDVVAE